jgi:hypothetical protein
VIFRGGSINFSPRYCIEYFIYPIVKKVCKLILSSYMVTKVYFFELVGLYLVANRYMHDPNFF